MSLTIQLWPILRIYYFFGQFPFKVIEGSRLIPRKSLYFFANYVLATFFIRGLWIFMSKIVENAIDLPEKPRTINNDITNFITLFLKAIELTANFLVFYNFFEFTEQMADLFNCFHNKVQFEKKIYQHYGTYTFMLCLSITNLSFMSIMLYYKVQNIEKIGIPYFTGRAFVCQVVCDINKFEFRGKSK